MSMGAEKIRPAMLAWAAGAALAICLPIANAADYELSADGNAVLRLNPSASIGSAGFDASLITSAYSGWTVTKSSAAPGGSISISNYAAGWKTPTLGGARIETRYSQTNAMTGSNLLHWVQTIDTNLPLGGTTTPYVDPRPNDDNLPFYWTTAEQATRSTATSVLFSDFSTRAQSSLATTNPINWNASLYQVEYDGAQAVTVRDGVSWGWTMKPATVGVSSAQFIGPTPTCPPATCSGLGSSMVTWGTGAPGSLSFAATAFAPVVGDLFKLGTLTYHNGATTNRSSIDAIGLDINLSFTNIAEADFTYHSSLSINNTPNTNDPAASADYVAFSSGGFTNSFRVFEGDTASADIMARLTPPLGLSPAVAGGDKDPDGTLLPSVGGFGMELVAFANPSQGGFISAVPEPATYALLLVGLGSILIAARNRRNADMSSGHRWHGGRS